MLDELERTGVVKLVETLWVIPLVPVVVSSCFGNWVQYGKHLKNLDLVFDKSSRVGFKLNLKKSEFFKKEIKYLGHIINNEGLQKDSDKIKAIKKCPRNQNISEIKAYAGMVNYYGRFVGNLLWNDTELKWSS